MRCSGDSVSTSLSEKPDEACDSGAGDGILMNTKSADLSERLSEARRQVEAQCQVLVNTGTAKWCVNDVGDTALHMDSRPVFSHESVWS